MTKTRTEKSGKSKASLKLPAAVRWIREMLALVFWGLGLVQLFIFDVARYLAEHIDGFDGVLRFRLPVALGVLSLAWLILGNRRFLLFIGYIIAYPLVVLFWILPRLLFRNWPVVVAFSPGIHALFRAFKSSFILSSGALIAVFMTCLSSYWPGIVICMAFLIIYLIIHFIKRFRVAFSPSNVFSDFGDSIRKFWERFNKYSSVFSKLPEESETESEKYKKEFSDNLLSAYMTTSVVYVFADRLRKVSKSRLLDLYFLGSLLYTFLLTTVIFAIEYLGIERLQPGSYTGIYNPGLFHFAGLSFSTLMTSDLSPLRPVTGLAQGAAYVQLFGSLLIIVLLVFVILTSIRERYKEDLGSVVDEIQAVSEKMRKSLESNYDLTIAAAEEMLLKVNPVVTNWLLKMRYGDERADEISAAASNDKPTSTPSPPAGQA